MNADSIWFFNITSKIRVDLHLHYHFQYK